FMKKYLLSRTKMKEGYLYEIYISERSYPIFLTECAVVDFDFYSQHAQDTNTPPRIPCVNFHSPPIGVKASLQAFV
ncbi:hypothetical protein, partial [Acetobacter ghanensis]|uniref:hypothetical protein n=1 Tax=Acetobacter ghanensis TaxID=431306 RepID=UPI00223180C7